ncbi:hypothetical protein Glove_109g435 [Diversispora epigaea]|uniref:Uncharacterized protein n=1 Tax=Diversispora epigaea TaxID=1348612 RepID=A0A397J6V0_9GLOM|nr:hypothetical protein Glove_109g435 [Diversispora epigaea]
MAETSENETIDKVQDAQINADYYSKVNLMMDFTIAKGQHEAVLKKFDNIMIIHLKTSGFSFYYGITKDPEYMIAPCSYYFKGNHLNNNFNISDGVISRSEVLDVHGDNGIGKIINLGNCS